MAFSFPDGSRGPVSVDSAGHTFDAFGTTSNRSGGHVWAGGVLARPSIHTVSAIPAELGGVDYSSPGHGLVLLHANKGITFDLEAIRRANPGCKLLRFRAVGGNTEIYSDERLTPVYAADLWVLVDGQKRFRAGRSIAAPAWFGLSFRIAEHDRFLTLVATDGGHGFKADWILFGDPRLELLVTTTGNEPNSQPK